MGFTVEIGWGFIEGLLTSLLGDTLHVADGTGELADYKTITIGEGATATVIPLPKMNNDRALSLSINHASAMYNRSLEIDLRLGFNKNDESAVNLKIHNFVLTSGKISRKGTSGSARRRAILTKPAQETAYLTQSTAPMQTRSPDLC